MMKNKELFDRTIAILVKAYTNETLQHGQPCGCAIGNLIAANNDLKIIKKAGSNWVYDDGKKTKTANWTEVHSYGMMLNNVKDDDYEKGIKELLSTGYDTIRTCLIEAAFEKPCIVDGDYLDDDSIDPDGYKGLMSVVDCLMKIHEATTEEANEAKSLFVKA